MEDNRLIPDSPIDFIRRCIREEKVWWTYHVNMRLKGRSISRRIILESNEEYEIIEEYPEDKYLPSYLIYSEHQGIRFHVLIAIDVKGDNIRIVTTYKPDLLDWDINLKIRRGKQ